MKYHFRAHLDQGECWAECIEIPGCLTQGENFEDLKANAYESLNLMLDEPENSKAVFQLPQKKLGNKKDVFTVPVDPKISFSFLLRQTRISKGITQKAMAKHLGLENIYSYQRLESKANPTISTVSRILEAFPDFPIEFVFN